MKEQDRGPGSARGVRRPLKFIAGASAGGHANELLLLLEVAEGRLWPIAPTAYVTTMEITATAFASRGKPVYVIGESDRKKAFRAIGVFFRACFLALRLRPDLIVTTGSMPLAMFAICSKLCGARVVWIDSIAQIEELSLSGRVMRHVADLCLAQWPEVAAKYPDVEYAGELL
jgi:UDP-N-acetylglucosamine:LPS N-acetylglucosamine transferase